MSQFIELVDELYRKALDGEVEDHIMDTLKMVSKTLDEDGIEAKFITSRMSEYSPSQRTEITLKIAIDSCFLIDYESAKSLPNNFAALGDAIIRESPGRYFSDNSSPAIGVDPVYGQGMAKAMMDSATLNGALRACALERDGEGYPMLGGEFQKLMLARQLPRTKPCWDSSRFAVSV